MKSCMKKRGKNDTINTINWLVIRLFIVIGIVITATIIDYFTHLINSEFYVQNEYFRNKIIFATLWGYLATFLFYKLKTPFMKAILFSGVIAVLLQVKYFLQGYDLFFVILFLFLHFFMFFLPSWMVFLKLQKYF